MKSAIVGTLVASAVMNALAFAAQADAPLAYPAAALGEAILALIYCLSRVAFGLSVTSWGRTPATSGRAPERGVFMARWPTIFF